MKKKKWLWLVLTVFIVMLTLVCFRYGKILSSNTAFDEKTKVVFIRDTMAFETWVNNPDNNGVFKNPQLLLRTAELKNLKTLNPGRYLIQKGMNSNAIVNMLRIAGQTPLKIRTDNVKTLEELAGKLGKNFRNDSVAFISAFTDKETCAKYGVNPITIACMLMPNTYEFYWTITPAEYLKKMNGIYLNYWTDDNQKKAKDLNLSKTDVSILASIVKAETGKTVEAPKIAGLYLNRLRINMPLQSDPTATFGNAVKNAQRVYFGDFMNDSPYNTYRNAGLPPGPINFPEKVYLDAVLNAEKHSYVYMCAQPGGTGLHNFAKTLDQHNVYSSQYHKWLNQRGIR